MNRTFKFDISFFYFLSRSSRGILEGGNWAQILIPAIFILQTKSVWLHCKLLRLLAMMMCFLICAILFLRKLNCFSGFQSYLYTLILYREMLLYGVGFCDLIIISFFLQYLNTVTKHFFMWFLGLSPDKLKCLWSWNYLFVCRCQNCSIWVLCAFIGQRH